MGFWRRSPVHVVAFGKTFLKKKTLSIMPLIKKMQSKLSVICFRKILRSGNLYSPLYILVFVLIQWLQCSPDFFESCIILARHCLQHLEKLLFTPLLNFVLVGFSKFWIWISLTLFPQICKESLAEKVSYGALRFSRRHCCSLRSQTKLKLLLLWNGLKHDPGTSIRDQISAV